MRTPPSLVSSPKSFQEAVRSVDDPLQDLIHRLDSEKRVIKTRDQQPAKQVATAYPPPWKWAYADGVICGRLRACLFANTVNLDFFNPLHVAVIGQDLGVYGHVDLRDYIGYVHRVPPVRSRGWFSGISKFTNRLLGMIFIVLLGMVTGFALFRPTLRIEADVASVALFSKLQFAQVNSGLTISGTVQFELSISIPSYIPQQLFLYHDDDNLTANLGGDPFNDTTHGGRVIGLLVPFGTANTSLYQPLGFAVPALHTQPRIYSQERVMRVPFNLTVRLDSQNKQDGFATHLSKPISWRGSSADSLVIECGNASRAASLTPSFVSTEAVAASSLDATDNSSSTAPPTSPPLSGPGEGYSCETILDLYLDQCRLGFVLMEAAVMHLTYQDITGGVYSQLFRTNPFAVPCETSSGNQLQTP
eukprot:Gregarina_sp_Pseudo_9__1102@NODE_1719_length_1370_cov_12_589782_g1593_i0_p1_GENE_NODE_1719_length_1370_cov_12_589782_g1593_i0NODE_1719_length_1370_cov_12_589782_g1593_i0_p1_ORF_typecomplete_len427_score67_14_NODE_1719_length_1370_cov_12_589782_g1593_i0301283